jgi:hypothetical protein
MGGGRQLAKRGAACPTAGPRRGGSSPVVYGRPCERARTPCVCLSCSPLSRATQYSTQAPRCRGPHLCAVADDHVRPELA